jgi:hypothetical protein
MGTDSDSELSSTQRSHDDRGKARALQQDCLEDCSDEDEEEENDVRYCEKFAVVVWEEV